MKITLNKLIPHFYKRTSLIYCYSEKSLLNQNTLDHYWWTSATHETVNYFFSKDEERKNSLFRIMKKGAIGVIIHDQDQWLAHGFIAPPGTKVIDHLPCKMTFNNWWFFYMHTKKEYRGQGLQKLCLSLRLNMVKNLAKTSPSIMVDTGINNVPSQKALLRAGFKPYGVLRVTNMKIPKIGNKVVYFNWQQNEKHPLEVGRDN